MEKCFKIFPLKLLANVNQTLIKWCLGGHHSELYPMTSLPTKTAAISRYIFDIGPLIGKCLKITAETAWQIWTILWLN